MYKESKPLGSQKHTREDTRGRSQENLEKEPISCTSKKHKPQKRSQFTGGRARAPKNGKRATDPFNAASSARGLAGSRGGCSCRRVLMADGGFGLLQRNVSQGLGYAWLGLPAWRASCTLRLSSSQVATVSLVSREPDGLDLARIAGWSSLTCCLCLLSDASALEKRRQDTLRGCRSVEDAAHGSERHLLQMPSLPFLRKSMTASLHQQQKKQQKWQNFHQTNELRRSGRQSFDTSSKTKGWQQVRKKYFVQSRS